MVSQALLRELGRRLRSMRQAAGMNVSELARRAGVSRRYVTEAEAGRANPSIGKLADLARACGARLGALCDLDLAPRSERVALVGLRGAGKSTVGRRLALELEVPFVELDERIERVAGLSLGEIFDLHGEEHFHRLTAETLEDVLSEGNLVLATGGSIVNSEANFERLRQTCRTVWLRASPDDHYQRVVDQGDRRPMRDHPRARAELEALLRAREEAYGRCELTVETSGRDVDEVLQEVCARL